MPFFGGLLAAGGGGLGEVSDIENRRLQREREDRIAESERARLEASMRGQGLEYDPMVVDRTGSTNYSDMIRERLEAMSGAGGLGMAAGQPGGGMEDRGITGMPAAPTFTEDVPQVQFRDDPWSYNPEMDTQLARERERNALAMDRDEARHRMTLDEIEARGEQTRMSYDARRDATNPNVPEGTDMVARRQRFLEASDIVNRLIAASNNPEMDVAEKQTLMRVLDAQLRSKGFNSVEDFQRQYARETGGTPGNVFDYSLLNEVNDVPGGAPARGAQPDVPPGGAGTGQPSPTASAAVERARALAESGMSSVAILSMMEQAGAPYGDIEEVRAFLERNGIGS